MARALADEQLLSRCHERAEHVLVSIDQHGWICGMPNGVETPGLMTGLSGIGYGLLRLAEPEIPSVLALEAPH